MAATMTQTVDLSTIMAEALRLQESGHVAQAMVLYRRVLVIQPNHLEALNNLGNLLRKHQQPTEALLMFQRALALAPNLAEIHNNIGGVYFGLGQHQAALQSYQRAITLNPNMAQAYFNIGTLYQKQKNYLQAAKLYHQAVAINPNYNNALFNLATLYKDSGDFEKANLYFNRVLALNPNYAEALNNLGVLYQGQERWDESIVFFERALLLKPNLMESLNNLGNVYHQQGRLKEALVQYDKVLATRPDYYQVWVNKAVVLQESGRIKESQACFERAVSLDPDYTEGACYSAFNYLLQGDFERGWKAYRNRYKVDVYIERNHTDKYVEPLWEGQAIAKSKTLLVHSEQGFGDTIQFLRYLPLLRKRIKGKIILQCQPGLFRLFEQLGPTYYDEIVCEVDPIRAHDFHVPIMTLAELFETRLDTIPNEVPYIFPDATLVSTWKKRMDLTPKTLHIGFGWTGDPKNRHNRYRSCDINLFRQLAEVPGVKLYSLQVGEQAMELETLLEPFPGVNLGKHIYDFADTAAIMANLDMIVSVETALVHLAGAMAIPTWVPLAHIPEWRWLLDREDSPWYPTIRLFRQPDFGDWASVFGRIKASLGDEVARRF